ncbi:serine O-acetyltransferase [Clostridium lacusfryxellense]|uniref:serine O-acetyltransferase n=1 Tax=Clostridium lacusfryxellense TaxID=205328 RepID=UPI001C0AC010|nr:serine acetyltransferase [Clostridium lacusfryxellense]MBU3114799.1 serine acetyltransferase [Clostridium lacusfryxellense]
MSSKSLSYLKADVYRLTKTYSNKQIVKSVLLNRNFRPIFTMRMCQYLNEKSSMLNKFLLNCFRVLHKMVCNKAGIEFSWQTSIGPGFCLTHGWGTVINFNAVIGSNVTIFKGVIIGTKHKIQENGERLEEYPTIKDNVWIGANSVIIGNVTIGEGAIIAPLSMIYKNVGAHTAVGCNPQKILKENIIEDVFNKFDIKSI